MRRKIYNKLKEWKQNNARKEALLIDGARRVGKSHRVEEVAKNENKTKELLQNGEDVLKGIEKQQEENSKLLYVVN